MSHCLSSTCPDCPMHQKHAFCNLPEDARAFLAANSVAMEYPRGTVVFREGDRCDAVVVLCSGKMKISASSREGRRMILRIAGGGSVLGLSAALAEKTHEATAEALEPCRVRVLRKRSLEELMEQYPQAAVAAAKTLADEYRAAFEEARRIALPESPAGRLACLLLDWVGREREDHRTDTITMSLTHDELASMTATSRETVTRTLSRFRKDGLIQMRGVSLTVLQPQVLHQISAC